MERTPSEQPETYEKPAMPLRDEKTPEPDLDQDPALSQMREEFEEHTTDLKETDPE